MRALRKNTKKMAYVLYSDKQPVYARDSDGDVIYDDVDGEAVPRVVSYVSGFSTPVDFRGNIAFSGGETEAAVYGVSVDAYDSKLIMPKNSIPITETSLIFDESEPEYDTSGNLKESSADFRVVKIAKSLNETAYLLKRITHNA